MVQAACPSIEPSKSARKKLLKAKLKAQPAPGTRCAFRQVEKDYLTRNPPPDYSHVIDFSHEKLPDGVVASQANGLTYSTHCDDGRHNSQLNVGLFVYTIDAHPGLFIIPDALSSNSQRDFIKSCMRDMTLKPNLNNLDTHYDLPNEGLWYHYESHFRDPATRPDTVVKPLCLAAQVDAAVDKQPTSRKLVNDPPITSGTPVEVLRSKKDPAQASTSLKPLPVSELLYKLRWTNLGLLYHWGTKSYHYEDIFQNGAESMIKVPTYLAALSKNILDIVPRELIPPMETWSDFQPESGIINFYQLKDTLMGHIDQSELVEDKPLVSLSFGHTTVFLIGHKTRDVAPTAIYLRSGDALIMSGACRRAYHGVPRIVEGSLPKHLQHSTDWDNSDRETTTQEQRDDWDVFAKYMSTTRINVNIRQVFPRDYLSSISKLSIV
ncbi:AlkB-like protein [Taphrina deformans PYCC 5710]|uniref:AlkB-like protein n=1 Tax=Taphrina deformans (strain PYCC 5710 / ATCC 11124 / CBS 356.35 / IMI 108563 / JCM 9778 / NBRC 8474) TaxID=1097556 RepID=R4XDG2_TAPDE|nr:AlkB-like protein [Taphrina deformans PYCC 5710]|eukprot:CCG81384.1 AlkB-like protein [Taphrina deformans PYCC 5710]